MRISSLAPLLALAGCGDAPQGEAPAGQAIACALDGAAQFASVCTVERRDDGYVLHRPDGGFRRFDAALEPLDGADPARVTPLAGGGREIAIAADRYRIPAAR
jgi:hypothetical protein